MEKRIKQIQHSTIPITTVHRFNVNNYKTAILNTTWGCIIIQKTIFNKRTQEVWLTNAEINTIKQPSNPNDGIDIISELCQIERRLSLMIQQQIKGNMDNTLLLETRDYTRKLLRQLGYNQPF